jgi:hypothetical protein
LSDPEDLTGFLSMKALFSGYLDRIESLWTQRFPRFVAKGRRHRGYPASLHFDQV